MMTLLVMAVTFCLLAFALRLLLQIDADAPINVHAPLSQESPTAADLDEIKPTTNVELNNVTTENAGEIIAENAITTTRSATDERPQGEELQREEAHARLMGHPMTFGHLLWTILVWFTLMFVAQIVVLFAVGGQPEKGGFPLRALMLGTTLWHALTVIVLLHWFRYDLRIPSRWLGLNDVQWRKHCAQGILLFLIWYPLVLGSTLAARVIWPPQVQHPALILLLERNLLDTVLVVVAVGVAAPIAEELVFRGILQTWAIRTLGPAPGILFAASSFGIMHPTWPDAIPLTIFGIGLGLALYRTGSLWTSMSLHATFNMVMVLSLLLSPSDHRDTDLPPSNEPPTEIKAAEKP